MPLETCKLVGNTAAGSVMVGLLSEPDGYACQAFAERDTELAFVLANGLVAIFSGVVTGAIGGAATGGGD